MQQFFIDKFQESCILNICLRYKLCFLKGSGGVKIATENENLVLGMIKEDPSISLHKLSKLTGLSRSSIAEIIFRLIKDEQISANAYDLNENRPIICVGGANVDRKLYAKFKLINETSNPVKSSRTVGGVARNIAENLGRLGEQVALISVSGNDLEWEEIYNISSPFINLEHVTQFDKSSTGSYTAVLDRAGDL